MQILIDQWKQSRHIVFLTGAGMSTESGLPDFRSAAGLWKNRDPRVLASVHSLKNNSREFYDFYTMRITHLAKVNPNIGHQVLAQLEKRNLLSTIITQNVDQLHQLAGSKHVIELHGNLREVSCLRCNRVMPSPTLLSTLYCPQCQGSLRPNVVLFGESLPAEALEEADQEARQADLFVVVGTSLEVSPANFFPRIAKQHGAFLTIINREATALDEEADLLIRGSASDVLAEIAKKLELGT